MPYFDLIDEAVIDADLSSTFKAILDANHWHRWWMPYIEAKIRGNEKLIKINSIVEVKIHYIITTKFSAKIKEVKRNEKIKVEYFEGDLLGTGEWFFEPIDGRTKVRYHFQAKPNRMLIRILLRFINFQKVHSKIMQSGFKGLNKYLAEKLTDLDQ